MNFENVHFMHSLIQKNIQGNNVKDTKRKEMKGSAEQRRRCVRQIVLIKRESIFIFGRK